jgi:hypothetical protein
MRLQKIPVIAGTNRDTPSIEGIRLQQCSWQRRQVRESGMAQQSEQALVNVCSAFFAESSMAQSCHRLGEARVSRVHRILPLFPHATTSLLLSYFCCRNRKMAVFFRVAFKK